MARISLAEDFSPFPAGRYHPDDGPYTGQRFREERLVPALGKLGEAERLEVVFDGVEGCGSSFLDEAFGGLVRDAGFSKAFLKKHLCLTISDSDLKDVVGLAYQHIAEAEV